MFRLGFVFLCPPLTAPSVPEGTSGVSGLVLPQETGEPSGKSASSSSWWLLTKVHSSSGTMRTSFFHDEFSGYKRVLLFY